MSNLALTGGTPVVPQGMTKSWPPMNQADRDAVMAVFDSDQLHGTAAPCALELQKRWAEYVGTKYALVTNSGTAAIHMGVAAAGIGPGDEVITTPFSFVASANCILFVGATPVFVDIDPKTMNLDHTRLEAAITDKTRAIVAVECFGNPAGLREIERIAQKHELILIEDCCEGFGGKSAGRAIGSFGRAGVFAFYPNKQITTGEGGMIVTDDDTFAQTCRSLRNQGRAGMAWLAHQRLGYNYRLSEIHAALGVAQVSRLEEILDGRKRVANRYMQRLMTNRYLILPTLADDQEMSWFVFVVRLNDLFATNDRDEIMIALRSEGIGCNNYFPPIHLQPYMSEQFGFRPGDYPVCEYVSNRTLALPFHTRLSEAEVLKVCDTLERVIEKQLVGRSGRM